MQTLLKLTAAAGLAIVLGGCAPLTSSCESCRSDARQPTPALDDIQTITVTGYGAPKSTFESLPQRRLMALRASELDAYRKIAEQVSGLHIIGDTRVDDFIPDRDRLRAYLNSFVQGAAITHQEFTDEGLAVTTMSLRISRSRLQQLLDEERRWHARGGNLSIGTAYPSQRFAPNY